jgi:hypothetical protein
MAASKEAAAYDHAHPGAEAPKEAVSHIQSAVEKLQSFQQNLQLDEALCTQLFMVASSLKRGRADLRANALQVQLEGIVFGLIGNLRSRLFLFVPKEHASFHDNLQFFGMAPFVFWEAAKDMQDAGNCYALGLPNACIFHSTRVSEYGLRAIARKLKVSIRDKRRPCAVEYATWDRVIAAIDNRIAKIRQMSAGPKKNGDLMFYSDANSQCRYIRDIWRNENSHTRKRYNDAEALAAMTRVAQFMQLLADGLYTDAERHELILGALGRENAKTQLGIPLGESSERPTLQPRSIAPPR